MTDCRSCKGAYDETDPESVQHHTEPVFCSKWSRTCTRCDGKPACYSCTSSFCYCTNAH